MARSKKTAPRKKARGRRWGAWVFAFLALVVCAAVLAMHISASVVHVQYAQVYLQDLPAAFEGYEAAIRFRHPSDGCQHAAAREKTDGIARAVATGSFALGAVITPAKACWKCTRKTPRSAQASRRREFFEAIAAFPAPMGKYAVAGNHDVSIPRPAGGPRGGQHHAVAETKPFACFRGNDALTIAGLDDFSLGERNVQGMGSMVASGDCVIVLSHSPDACSRHHRLGSGRWRQMGGPGAQRAHARRPISLAGLVAPHSLHLRGKVPFRLGGRKRPQYAREQWRGAVRQSTCAGVRQRKRT